MNLKERIAKARQELHNRYSSVTPDQLPVSPKKSFHPGSLRSMILSDASESQYASEQDNLSHQLKQRIQALRKERGLL